MKTQKTSSVKKNFAYQMIYEVLVLILPFVTSPYIARVIGAEGLGTYSYSYSVAYYFVLFSLLGIKNYGNREIAKARDDSAKLNKTFVNIATLHILLSIVCVLAYIGYIISLKQVRIYAEIQTLYVLSGLLDISWFYFGIERFKMIVTRNTIIKIINVICVFVFVRSADDLWKYCLIMALGNLISQIALWVPLRRYVEFVRPDWASMKKHMKPLTILFIPAIAVSMYKYMDKIMIGAFSSKTELGYYENAEKVINIPMTVITSFGTVMLPKMSNLTASSNHNSAERYMTLSMEFVMCLATAFTFGLAGVGTVFAPFFWGKEFTVSGQLIMGLALTIPFISFANVIRTQYLIPTSKDREYITSVIAGAVVNLCINGLLIPQIGAFGAMIGTIAAEMIVCIWQVIVVRKELPIRKFLSVSVPFIPFGILMFAVIIGIKIIFKSGIEALLLQVVLGGGLYLGLCLWYFVKTQNEVVLRMIKTAKKRFLKNNQL